MYIYLKTRAQSHTIHYTHTHMVDLEVYTLHSCLGANCLLIILQPVIILNGKIEDLLFTSPSYHAK